MFENWPDLVPLSLVRSDCKFSPRKLLRLVKQPGFPSVRIGDKFYILKAPFIAWLEKQSLKDKSKAD